METRSVAILRVLVILVLGAGAAAPAAAQSAACCLPSAFLPAWVLSAGLTWVLSAALLTAVTLLVVIPWLASEEERRPVQAARGWPTTEAATAFSALTWKDARGQMTDWLLVGGSDGMLRVLNRQTGRTAASFRVDERLSTPITTLAVATRSGRIAVNAGIGHDVNLYRMDDVLRAAQGQRPPSVRLDRDALDMVSALAFSPDGSVLAVGSSTGSLALYPMDRARDGMPGSQKVHYAHREAITSVAFQPGAGVAAATASRDRTIRLWTTGWEGKLVAELDRHAGEPGMLAFNADGSLLAAAAGDSVLVYEVGSMVPAHLETLGHRAVRAVAWIGARIATAGEHEGALWTLPALVPVGGAPRDGLTSDERTGSVSRQALTHGGIYLAPTHNDAALLVVGRDAERRLSNVAWELPIRQLTRDPEPEVIDLAPEPSLSAPAARPALEADRAVVAQPQAPARRAAPARRPLTRTQKAGVAASLLVSLAPAYLAEVLASPRPAAPSVASGATAARAEYPQLQAAVRDLDTRIGAAARSSGKERHALWQKARYAAELIDHPDWLRAAGEEQAALKAHLLPVSTEALDDVAESRLDWTRASYELGDKPGAAAAARKLLTDYSLASVASGKSSRQPIANALRVELPAVYREVAHAPSKPARAAKPGRHSGTPIKSSKRASAPKRARTLTGHRR